jgi:hypothetical protein
MRDKNKTYHKSKNTLFIPVRKEFFPKKSKPRTAFILRGVFKIEYSKAILNVPSRFFQFNKNQTYTQ